ncbi:MAG TPA: hypothetical protein VFC26_08820, partial [Verrucomicrobiae bacterium]|nr:hypothetical protein [Verrucomicrobiae bacterium]
MFALSQADAQTVQFQLRNGDRVSGEIAAETADGLTLKTPWGGIIGVPAREIFSGRLIPAPANGSVPPAVLTPVATPSPQGGPPTKTHKW